MTSNPPLVSVVIPTHNRPDLLLESLGSIAAQSLTDWEAIVVDDGSLPAVNESLIQEKFGKNVRVIRHSHAQGGASAKNTGVKASTGKYLAFLDDDDLFAETYLENAIAALEANPHLTTLFMGVSYFGLNAEWAMTNVPLALEKVLLEAQGINITDRLIQFDRLLFTALLKSIPMPFQRPVTTRSHFHHVGHFQPGYLLVDCDWALRASLGNICGLLNEGLYLQRVDGQGYSSQPSQRLKHALAGFAMKKRILANPQATVYKSQVVEAILEAGRNLAWEHIKQGEGIKAFNILINSLNYGVNRLQLKFLLHALYACIRKNNTANS